MAAKARRQGQGVDRGDGARDRYRRALYWSNRLQESGLSPDPTLHRMIRAEIQHSNEVRARELARIIDQAASRATLAGDNFAPAPTQEALVGEVPLAFVVGGDRGPPAVFHLPHKAIVRQVVFTGQTGTGKSTSTRHVIRGIGDDIATLLLDPKDDYAAMPGMARFVWPEWRWNPLERHDWLPAAYRSSIVVECLIEAFDLMEASRALLTRTLRDMDDRYRDGQFTLSDFQEFLARLRPRSTREGQTRESVLSKVDGLLAGCGQMFDCQRGIYPGDLFGSKVVLSLFGLQSSACYFLCNLTLATLMAWARMHGLRGDRLRLVVVAEEARITMFDRNRERRFEVSIPQSSVLASTCREFGIGLVVVDNVYNGLSESVRTNCGTLISFRQGGQNVRDVAAAMNLNAEQAEELMSLPIGQAIVRTPSFPRPFKIRVPENPNELLR